MVDFKELGKTPVVNYKLKLVGTLFGPVDLMLLREEIILQISSSVIWLIMMDSWTLDSQKTEKKKKSENLILDCTFWATVEKNP